MVQPFLTLPESDRAAILTTKAAGNPLGLSPALLEKDVWVCWTLQALFEIEEVLPMVFKGGTSLSKVFAAIDRFSEDIDITVDRNALLPGCDPLADRISRSQLKRFRTEVEAKLSNYLEGTVVPRLEAAASAFAVDLRIELDHENHTVRVHYPPAAEPVAYVEPRVLLEFGGCNAVNPAATHVVAPYLEVDDLAFPSARVSVLAAERTFWEKATLAHAECGRGIRASKDRLARHWYDLYQLAEDAIGVRALKDRDLLADVVRNKEAFYRSASSDYLACLRGALRLIPDEAGLRELKRDFDKMKSARMFYREPPPFQMIINRLRALETQINEGPVER